MGMWTTCSRPAAKGTALPSRCNGGTRCCHSAWRETESQLLSWKIASARSRMFSEKIFHLKGQSVLPKVSHSIRMQRLSSCSCVIVWTANAECRWQRQYADLTSIFCSSMCFPGNCCRALTIQQSRRVRHCPYMHCWSFSLSTC